MRLKNARKGPIIGTDLFENADGQMMNRGTETCFVKPGKVGNFDTKNPAVKIYAKAGYLVGVDKKSEDWIKSLI